jgi:hypothetical protein
MSDALLVAREPNLVSDDPRAFNSASATPESSGRSDPELESGGSCSPAPAISLLLSDRDSCARR